MTQYMLESSIVFVGPSPVDIKTNYLLQQVSWIANPSQSILITKFDHVEGQLAVLSNLQLKWKRRTKVDLKEAAMAGEPAIYFLSPAEVIQL